MGSVFWPWRITGMRLVAGEECGLLLAFVTEDGAFWFSLLLGALYCGLLYFRSSGNIPRRSSRKSHVMFSRACTERLCLCHWLNDHGAEV